MSDPLLIVKEISKKYSIPRPEQQSQAQSDHNIFQEDDYNDCIDFYALKNINFRVNQGDVLGIIGENGSGKSTLLSILGNIVRPSEGSVEIYGTVTSILSIGSGFHPDLSGRENIFLYGKMLGMTKLLIENRFEDIVEFSGIRTFLNSSVKNYSSGMYLRLAMSVAIHSDVDIFILDEIMAVGDAEFRMKVMDRVRKMLALGKTLIMASHSMNEVLQLCNKCILLKKGEINFYGITSDAINHYLEPSYHKSPRSSENIDKEERYQWEWNEKDTAPGNESIKIHKICIKSSTERVKPKIYIEDAMDVEVEFWKLETGVTFQLNLLFSDKMNNLIFHSNIAYNSTDIPLYKLFEDETGLFKMKCQIPGSFFNHGTYSLQLRFGKNMVDELFIYPKLFRFNIHENPKGTYFNFRDFPVPLRPSFPWEHVRISF